MEYIIGIENWKGCFWEGICAIQYINTKYRLTATQLYWVGGWKRIDDGKACMENWGSLQSGKGEKYTADKHWNKTQIYTRRYQLWETAAAGISCCHLVISDGMIPSEPMNHSACEAKQLLLKQHLIMALQ